MNKESFLDLLDRYQQNNCTENEKLFVEQWYESLNREDHAALTSTEVTKMGDRILLRLHANMERRTMLHSESGIQSEQLRKTSRNISWYKMGIAASITIAVICSFLFTFNYNNSENAFKDENSEGVLLSKINTSGSALTVTLSDHSKVILQPNAEITYPAIFKKSSRNIYLKGDAFFAVSKNPKKPFYVYNNKLTVKVLGTSFFIKEAGAQVSVRTGKVAVNENTNCRLFSFRKGKKAKGVLLTPNQQAVFDSDVHELKKTLVDKPLPLSVINHLPEAISFNFSETSLKNVFSALSKSYGIEIELEDQKVNDCTFTGDIDNKDLYEQLNLICESISGSYHINGTSILIKAKHCN